MKVMQVNAVNYGSTGNIMNSIHDELILRGNSSMYTHGFTWTRKKSANVFITSGIMSKSFHKIISTITGAIGFFSIVPTLITINKIKAFNPDIIHLHNIHGWYINFPILFKYLERRNKPLIWTFHDCWAFTGHCAHFEMVNCKKWQNECYNCPVYKQYPKSIFDNSKFMFKYKSKVFPILPKLTIITPSKWLKQQVEKSFFKDKPIKVIYNGVNPQVFFPRESEFRNSHNLMDKKIILGVSLGWTNKKGLDIFIKLAKLLDESYKIVLVGTDKKTDKILPKNIISINKTSNQEELSEIYSTSDVFVNPTREEVFGLVNVEALSCGLPVITFNTGGSPETIDFKSGIVVEKNDIVDLVTKIKYVCENKPFKKSDCIKRGNSFDSKKMLDEYLSLYEALSNSES